MEKKIENYLHLYVWQKCVVRYKLDKEEVEKTLTPVHLHEFLNECAVCKPILRPFSDMEDYERTVVYDLEMRDEEIDYSRKVQCVKIWYSRTSFFMLNKWNQETFRYLLSRGFDIFGLIESGLAIDKTTLTR